MPTMRVAAQITPFGRRTGGHADHQVAVHSGGSARVLSNLLPLSVTVPAPVAPGFVLVTAPVRCRARSGVVTGASFRRGAGLTR